MLRIIVMILGKFGNFEGKKGKVPMPLKGIHLVMTAVVDKSVGYKIASLQGVHVPPGNRGIP